MTKVSKVLLQRGNEKIFLSPLDEAERKKTNKNIAGASSTSVCLDVSKQTKNTGGNFHFRFDRLSTFAVASRK